MYIIKCIYGQISVYMYVFYVMNMYPYLYTYRYKYVFYSLNIDVRHDIQCNVLNIPMYFSS
jgi:hypothetical protein